MIPNELSDKDGYGKDGVSYDWLSAFEVAKVAPVLNSKDVDLSGISPLAVKRVVALENGENDAEKWTGVFELYDGRFISVCSWCDYTGWDCQSGGEIFVGRDADSVIRYGLSEEERTRLKLSLDQP